MPVHGSFFSDLDKFLPKSSGLCWGLLHELLHDSLLLVVPSFAVPCFFTHGWVQEVSSVQTLATHRACFSTESWEVSAQAGSATTNALRDAICVKGTRDRGRPASLYANMLHRDLEVVAKLPSHGSSGFFLSWQPSLCSSLLSCALSLSLALPLSLSCNQERQRASLFLLAHESQECTVPPRPLCRNTFLRLPLTKCLHQLWKVRRTTLCSILSCSAGCRGSCLRVVLLDPHSSSSASRSSPRSSSLPDTSSSTLRSLPPRLVVPTSFPVSTCILVLQRQRCLPTPATNSVLFRCCLQVHFGLLVRQHHELRRLRVRSHAWRSSQSFMPHFLPPQTTFNFALPPTRMALPIAAASLSRFFDFDLSAPGHTLLAPPQSTRRSLSRAFLPQ